MKHPTRATDADSTYSAVRPRSSVRRDLMLVLLAIVATTLFLRVAPLEPAYAQLPDAGAQRAAILQELRTGNARLAEVTNLLKQIRDQTKPKTDKNETLKPRP